MAKKKPLAQLGRTVVYVDPGGNRYAAIITGGNDEAATLLVFYPGQATGRPASAIPHARSASDGQEHWAVS